jgi:anhydro-N-acetylmuramic acid kinase
MESKNKFKVIGLMSGTSMDGLDIAYCHFSKKEKTWKYSIENATTLRYPASWVEKLSTAQMLRGEELVELNVAYGRFLGKACDTFIKKHDLQVDFIASHGHTIFHQPTKGFTYQLGNGNALYAECGVPVVCDFRSLDVILGGEGAPLVPVGDKFLFGEYDVCLNLGGISNLSMDIKGKRVAFDVSFCNMGLNYLMAKTGKEFDEDGALSSLGEENFTMTKELNKVYNTLRRSRPSLGREIFENKIRPILDTTGVSLKDKLYTYTTTCVKEIAQAILSSKKNAKVLCTGGGAFNSFLISRLLDYCGDDATLIIPEDDIIKFKEALVFAFLGVLRVRGENNCLQSVTGAKRNSSSGVLIGFHY